MAVSLVPAGSPATRAAPHDLEAERAVLGAVLVRDAMFDELAADIAVDDFFLPGHREIWEAMTALRARRRPIEILVLGDELRTTGILARLEGGRAYLNDCANACPLAENGPHYARIVREKATLRRIIATAADVQSSAYGDFGEFDEFAAHAARSMAEAADVTRTAAGETLEDTAHQLLDEMERAERGEVVSRVPTGIESLDGLLKGGLAPEHLVVPCGLTSMGKSSWAFQVAFRGARDRQIPALIFSLEMSRQEVLVKAAANLAKMDTDDWSAEHGKVIDWKRITPATKAAAALSKLVRVEEHRHVSKIQATARRWRADNPGRALIVVDLIQKVNGVRAKGDNRQEEVRGVAAALKDMAKELKLPVIAPAQIDNDAAKDKRAPRLGDLRDSKAIEMEADVVIGIHRERMPEMKDGKPVYSSDCELIVLKHRGGRVGKRTVQWEGPWQGFED